MKKFLTSKQSELYILLGIVTLGLILRLYGINWDQNQHLHPDERFLTMVTQAIKFPKSLSSYLNPKVSTANPYNVNYSFYVYGTLPVYLNKLVSGVIKIYTFDYNNVTIIGRLLSAILDTGIILLVYQIARKIFNKEVAILSTFLYSISVLPIQLSHFYAVDTFLAFFLVLSIYFLFKLLQTNKIVYVTLLAVSLGFAVTSKISALLLLPIIVVGFVFLAFRNLGVKKLTLYLSGFLIFFYISLRFTDIHLFGNSTIFAPEVSQQFVNNIKELKSWDNPDAMFPPGVQWITTKPLIFPLKNIVFWGLGLPLGTLSLFGVLHSMLVLFKSFLKTIKSNFPHPKDFVHLKNYMKSFDNLTIKQFNHLLILLWILLVFFYQGIQFSKTIRYFYPIYPFLAILAANILNKLDIKLRSFRNKKLLLLFYSSTLLLLCIWPLSFMSIYSRPHSRVTASKWIYKNIPAGSTITCEYWDDCLPLSLENNNPYIYNTESLALYDPDSNQKWAKLNYQLKQADYLILSSNRLWGSIPTVPDRYPIASEFYSDLFAGKLQFIKVAEFTSYPTIPILNIQIPDDSAEEAFTVYDHPKVLIFKRI